MQKNLVCDSSVWPHLNNNSNSTTNNSQNKSELKKGSKITFVWVEFKTYLLRE